MNSSTWTYFFRDAVRRLRRPIAPTLVAVLIVFAGTTAVFATTGQAVAGQQRTLERINSPQGRLITITDAAGSAGLSPRSVATVGSLTGVDWVFGVSAAVDMTNANVPDGERVPARLVYGELPPAIVLDRDQSLAPGNAVAGPGLTQTLGLGDGVGAVSSRTRDATVVGGFTATSPLGALNRNLLIAAPVDSNDGRLITLWVSVSDVTLLAAVADAAARSLVAENIGALEITMASELAQLGEDVTRELAQTARLTVTGLLAAVVILIGALQYGRVAGIVRDIGRRRALGATRSMIVAQVLLDAGLCGLVGTVLGISAGLSINAVVAGALPGWGFTTGVGILVVLASLLGSIAPAIRAARVDPVRVLRVP